MRTVGPADQSWSVSDDLRGNDDRYSARASGTKRITWLFGDQ